MYETRHQRLHTRIRETGRKAYLPYVMLGYPTAEKSLDVCRVLLENGADGLELGLPFRDPVADGPVIQAAGNAALAGGFTIADAVTLVGRIRHLSPTAPLTLMSYYNMVMAPGIERFVGMFAAAGLDALLIPDMPAERASEIAPHTARHNIDLIFIAAPLTSERRLQMMAEFAGGFVYVVTRLGITGVESHYSDRLAELFGRVHACMKLPAYAGFGISEPEHARRMIGAGADGVIVGSRIVQLTRQAEAEGWDLTALAEHTRAMVLG